MPRDVFTRMKMPSATACDRARVPSESVGGGVVSMKEVTVVGLASFVRKNALAREANEISEVAQALCSMRNILRRQGVTGVATTA